MSIKVADLVPLLPGLTTVNLYEVNQRNHVTKQIASYDSSDKELVSKYGECIIIRLGPDARAKYGIKIYI